MATTDMPTITEPNRLRVFQATRKVGIAAHKNKLLPLKSILASLTTSEGSSMADKTATGTQRSQATTGGGSFFDESSRMGSKRGKYVTIPIPRMVMKIAR